MNKGQIERQDNNKGFLIVLVVFILFVCGTILGIGYLISIVF